MLDAISAEATKLSRHKASWFLVWLYPIAFVLVFAAMIGTALVRGEPPEQTGLAEWISDTTMIWSAPANTMGRYLIAAFVAVAFAGEYGWNTWKLIVPHRARPALIAAKYIVVAGLFTVAFLLTAAITVLGALLEDVLTGDTIPAGITAGALLPAHGERALTALGPALVTIGYASLAAILTRSTIAALVIAIVATTIEQLIFNFGPMLSLKAPALVTFLYHVLPGYHLANLAHAIETGRAALEVPFPKTGTVALPWSTSLGVVAAWVAGSAVLALLSFRRQDLN